MLMETTNLPVQQQLLLHADFLENEQVYLRMRDGLLAQYRGQWVAVHDGKVIAADRNLMKVMEIASTCRGHPFIAMAGGEDNVVFRARRSVHSYDLAYQPFAMPRLGATFWNDLRTKSLHDPDAIPDTGSDITLLPHADCLAIDLFQSLYITGMAGALVGTTSPAVFYKAHVEIAGLFYASLIQPIPGGKERIVGRDVLNEQRVLFDGPAGQVIVDP